VLKFLDTSVINNAREIVSRVGTKREESGGGGVSEHQEKEEEDDEAYS
jgi:hypothetical protein